MTMNKFFKSKSKKESKIISLEAEKNKRQKTQIMGSAIEKLASSFRGVVNKDINNDKTGVDEKNQGSSQPGIMERHKKIHKEKKQVDNKEETFKRVEIKETLIKKQSKLLIKKGPDDKIVVARQTHTTERSTKFAKNYLNCDPLEDVEVSSTTQDDQSSLMNLSNNLDEVSVNSNGNLSLKNNIKTYKNSQKIIGLNDSSESDSTILLMPCNLKKKKNIKKLNLKLNSLENKESKMIESVNPLSDSNFDKKKNSSLSKENLLNKKMSCEIQDKDVADSDSTFSSTPIESQNTKNIVRIDSVDSNSTVILTPVEQNTSVVNDTPEIDSDSTILLTPTEQPKNRKKKMNETSCEEPPKKKSKNFKTCEKVSNQSIYKVPQKFSPKNFKEKIIKIVKEEKLKKKIVAIFKHEGPAETDTLSISSSQELKDKLDEILEDEESVNNNNKSPKIDELRQKLTEMFGDDVLKSQIEPPSTLSNEEVLHILKPNQHVNSTVDTSVNERVNLSLSKKVNSLVKKSKGAEKKKNSKINKEKSSRSQEESNDKKSKVFEENETMDREELEDTLKLDESNDSQSRVLEETLKLSEIPELASYELVEVGDSNHQSYNEESDDWTDSSFGKLVIDESADETPELLDTSNLNEITEDLIDNEKDPLYVDNSDYPLAICVFEDENQSDEQQHVDSLKENNEADLRVRLTETQVDNSDISLKNFEKNRELLVVVDRVDVDKFKRKNSGKVASSLKVKLNLKEKISLSNSRTDPFDLCLKKELRVILERLPLKINQSTLKNKNKINITEPKNKIISKSNNFRERTNKIIKRKTGTENQKLLREVRIILTPIQLKNDQNLSNKQTNNSTISDETLTSPAVDKKRTRRNRESQNKDKALSLVSQSTRKRLDNSNSVREIKKTSSAKSSSKVVKNTSNSNNLARNRKLKLKLKAIKIKSNSSNLIQHQTLKELKVTLERISTADLAKWRKKN